MTSLNKNNAANLLSYETICNASMGDVDAISSVLKHYEGYIISLSMQIAADESGGLHYCVDEDLRRRLEAKLITKVMKFNPVPYKKKDR